MGELITDEMLETFAVVAPPDDAGRRASSPATARSSTASTSTRPYQSRSRGVDVGAATAEGRRLTDADADEAGVRAANSAFYAALEARDLDAMAEVWEHADRIVVTHPGWPMLRGWARVAGSWDAIFRNTGYIQFVLTDEQVTVVGDTAWVTLDENILQAGYFGRAVGLEGHQRQRVRAQSRFRRRRRQLEDGGAPRVAGECRG